MSASTTPTSVTLGKSSPLAIIWVPISRSTSPRSTAPRIRWCDHLVLVVSRSIRAIRASRIALRQHLLQLLGADAAHLLHRVGAPRQVNGSGSS